MTKEFQQWLKDQQCSLPKTLEIRSFDIGSGIFTHAPIDDKILEIPLSIVLTEDKAQQSPEGHAFNKVIPSPVSPRGLFYCFLISQRNQENSFFGPYLRSLPRQNNTPFYWTAEEKKLLAGTNLANTLRDTTAALLAEYTLYFPLLSKEFPKFFDATINFDEYVWAHSTYTSRGFPKEVGKSNGTLGCLLPLADIMNHQRLTPIEWKTSATKIIFNHRGSSGSVLANQQIFNNYGCKSNGEFLLGYGFCLPNNFKYDIINVIVGISIQDPLYKQKLELMNQHGLTRQSYLNDQQVSKELLKVMRIAVMDHLELAQVNPNDLSLEYVNVENELNMMDSLEQLIRHSLQNLILPSDSCSNIDSVNARNATLYRSGQQHILEVYLNQLLPEYHQQVIQQHLEEFAPYLEEEELTNVIDKL